MRQTSESTTIKDADSLQERTIHGLPAHVRLCMTARGAVFLDLKRNRYLGLAADQSQYLPYLLSMSHPSTFVTCDPSVPSADVLDTLVTVLTNAGLLESGKAVTDPDSPQATLQDPRLDFSQLEHPRQRCGPRQLWRFVGACRWARHAVRRRALWSVVEELSAGRRIDVRDPTAAHLQRAAALAQVFHRLRGYSFTARDQCLFHALALVQFLSYHQIAAAWVIGVQTLPWRAHSWVQLGPVVLDATPEHVLEFTPILVA